MDKVKILTISELYHPYGGAEYATHLILKYLQTSGKYEITVLTGTRNIETIRGVKYIYTSLLKPRPKPLFWLLVDFMCRQRLYKELIQRHNIVYIPRIAYPVILHAKKLGKKVIVHLHNYQPITYHSIYSKIDKNLNNPVKFELLEHNSILRAVAVGFLQHTNRLVKYWLLQADKIICVSEKQRNIIIKYIPELAKKIEVIPNPPPEIPPMKRRESYPLTALYLGGGSYIKGFHIVMDLARKLAKRNSRIKIIFAGRYDEMYKRLITELSRKAQNVVFEGYVHRDRLLELYSMSKILLFPSLSEEPAPYTIIEALCMGITVIGLKNIEHIVPHKCIHVQDSSHMKYKSDLSKLISIFSV